MSYLFNMFGICVKARWNFKLEWPILLMSLPERWMLQRFEILAPWDGVVKGLWSSA